MQIYRNQTTLVLDNNQYAIVNELAPDLSGDRQKKIRQWLRGKNLFWQPIKQMPKYHVERAKKAK